MRAVLWTDFVQFLLYVGGAIVAFRILLSRLPGGWSQMIEVGDAAGRLRVFDFGWDLANPYVFAAGLVGGVFVTFGSHGVDQLMVQRYLAARSLADARSALVLGGFVVFAQFALFLLIGVGLFAFYEAFPPAVPFDRTDRVFARFILTELPVGVVGVLLGAIFAAAMSTLSSSLNSCATVTARDLLRPAAEESPERLLRRTRRLTLGFAVAQIGVGVAGQWVDASVVSAVLGVAGFTIGIVLGAFALGMLTERVDGRSALAGMVFGLAVVSVVFFATDLAWPWFALVGSSLTFAGGLVASRVLPQARGAR